MPFAAVFLASLLGSPHCAAMCGGFAGIYSVEGRGGGGGHIGYNLGRLLTYLTLGALAGFFGSALSSTGRMAGVQESASLVMGIVLLVWGVLLVCRVRVSSYESHRAILQKLSFPLRFLLRLRSSLPSPLFAFLLGAVSTLLPCGWLYAQLAVAASSGTVLGALALMAAFWLGTLPVMGGVGMVARRLSARWGPAYPTMKAIVLLAAGVFSLASHAAPLYRSTVAPCHDRSTPQLK